MYTLKLHWTRHHGESPEHPIAVVDQMDQFIPAAEVVAHDHVKGDEWQENFKHWEQQTNFRVHLDYTDYDRADDGRTIRYNDGRLICVVGDDGASRWILASRAWLLNEDGRTIERLV